MELTNFVVTLEDVFASTPEDPELHPFYLETPILSVGVSGNEDEALPAIGQELVLR